MAREPWTAEVSESVRAATAAPLRSLVAFYSGYRQDGVPPARHRGLPSPYLTLIEGNRWSFGTYRGEPRKSG